LAEKESNKHADKRNPKTRGRSEETKTPILGVYEKEGKVMVKVLPWVSKKNVQKVINTHIAKNSIMVTDAYALYAFLKKDNRFTHVMVDHKNGQYVKDAFHTNGIENFWSILKRGIYGIYHQVNAKHLQRYCDEFAARYNSRQIKDNERFELSIQKSDGRLKYNDLKK